MLYMPLMIASGLWQIHPFCERNTRSTAVFIIKYLKTFGFDISNDMFFENLLMDKHHELKNRYMHIDYKGESANQSVNTDTSKCQNGTMELSLEEMAILRILQNEPAATQKELQNYPENRRER